MKKRLPVKFLKTLLSINQNSGFTLIEILVTIIIIGILSAVAWPSFINQSNKAKESEAKIYVGTVNRAQQAYRLENSSFASSISQLSISIHNTASYTYNIDGASATRARFTATPATIDLKAFSGCVSANPGDSVTGAIFLATPTSGTSNASAPTCPS
ncbi:prepilin-type N-terminal cleavage/methylation domain-containing protein [Chroococcidiopsis sp. FACHB-1243]|uniref:type IV pilin-like G/H family protein n=1 Tax=Chroococcidiopsis sp. [FACHB-1243] TaxID=2692781 RepID=UPI0017833455|nr:type IV pilin-like G/H family protein [Chroococcidiopsis sp. [FACHB-1243]]MBD2307502.1 prepilin-type N-terminal cleavage/methylation domain-containing protein [Chroococcidiopsis sp. [FACHB-1243]]